MAIGMGILGPYLWTVKNYYLKVALTRRKFGSSDLMIDYHMMAGVVLSILYGMKLADNKFDKEELLSATMPGLCFFAGNFFQVKAFETGPGGPTISLVDMQVAFQILISYAIRDKALKQLQVIGVGTSVLAAILITLWSPVCNWLARSCSRDQQFIQERTQL